MTVRQDIRELTLAGVDDIWVLLSETGYRHRAVDGAAAAAQWAADSEEAYRVVSVRDRIVDARQRFETEAERARTASAGRKAGRQRGQA